MKTNTAKPTIIERWMAPLYGKGGIYHQEEGMPEQILAPTLDEAFKQARMHWPTAAGWRCLGAVDPNDRECMLPDPLESAFAYAGPEIDQ